MMKKLRAFVQVVGWVTLGMLALYGALTLFGGRDRVRAAADGAVTVPAQVRAPGAATGAVPAVMNFQGHLKDANGNALNGTYAVTFRIYDDLSAPIAGALWSEQISVTVRDGYCSTLLGQSQPLPSGLFSAADRFLGVTVDPYYEMTPRQRLSSVPYAFFAGYASRLSASDGNPLDAVTVDNDGNVGIGTTAPTATLLVDGDIGWSGDLVGFSVIKYTVQSVNKCTIDAGVPNTVDMTDSATSFCALSRYYVHDVNSMTQDNAAAGCYITVKGGNYVLNARTECIGFIFSENPDVYCDAFCLKW